MGFYYTTNQEVKQMKRDDFYFCSLVVLLLIGIFRRWPAGLRVAVIANSVLVLIQCGERLWGKLHAR